MAIIFFDTETTGIGVNDRLCQLALKERGVAEPLLNSTYKPPLPISIEAMSVHHITEKMVATSPAFLESGEYRDVKNLFENSDTICVAHNASFDLGMLAREDVNPHNTICTYKVVRSLDAEGKFSQYKLQYLRYFLNIDIEASAHDAFGDVLILEAVFEHLLAQMIEKEGSEEAAIAKMIQISSRPMLFTTMPVGKHRGRKLADIARTDRSYIVWFLGEKKKENADENNDWIYSLNHYLTNV